MMKSGTDPLLTENTLSTVSKQSHAETLQLSVVSQLVLLEHEVLISTNLLLRLVYCLLCKNNTIDGASYLKTLQMPEKRLARAPVAGHIQ